MLLKTNDEYEKEIKRLKESRDIISKYLRKTMFKYYTLNILAVIVFIFILIMTYRFLEYNISIINTNIKILIFIVPFFVYIYLFQKMVYILEKKFNVNNELIKELKEKLISIDYTISANKRFKEIIKRK